MPTDHKHFVTVIETQAPDIYDGPRIAVFHTRKEADDDILEWINDELETDYDDADEAIDEYQVKTSRFAKIDEPDGSECLGCHGDPSCPPS